MMLLALLLAASPSCDAAITQADMNQCAFARSKRADAALNTAWAKLVAKAGPSRPAYVAAQRRWIQYRDAECAAEAKLNEGGSMQPMVISGCLADLTEARTKRIQMLASQDR